MLDETSYITALYVYIGSAIAAILCLTLWLRKRLRTLWALVLILLSAALLLTPAFPDEHADTMAPALIVAGFQYFTAGYEAAEHALRPLRFVSGVALVLSLVLRFVLFRQRPES